MKKINTDVYVEGNLLLKGLNGNIIGGSEDVENALESLDISLTEQNDTGFVEFYGSGDYWSASEVNGTFTMLRGGKGRVKGKSVEWTGGQTVALTINATNYVYADETGFISVTTTPSAALYSSNILLFEVCRLSDNKIFIVKENHPFPFDTQVSTFLHNVVGTVFRNGSFDFNRITTGTGTLTSDRKIKVVGNDILEDHGLATNIVDSAGNAIMLRFAFKDAVNQWACGAVQDELIMKYSNSGVLTNIDVNNYGVFKLYGLKDNLNDIAPNYIAVTHNAQFSNLSQALNAVNTGQIVTSSGTLESLEPCQIGYIIVRNNASGGYIDSIIMDRRTLRTGTTSGPISNQANSIITVITNFDKVLGAGDTNLQTALETIDENSVSVDKNQTISGVKTFTNNVGITSGVLGLKTAKTPLSAIDTGTLGDICWDSNYIYVCVATNSWKRSSITTW